jgi:hypothetical protein
LGRNQWFDIIKTVGGRMARKLAGKPAPGQLFRLNPGYDQRGGSPWHWLECEIPQDLYFAFFSDSPLFTSWQPPAARVVPERKAGDFYYAHGLFAAKLPAAEAIRRLLGEKVELLPLQVEGPQLVFLHPLEVADLSDSAEVARFEDGRIMYVEKWAFKPEAVAGKHLFAARGTTGSYIVSEQFRATVEKAGLGGLGFDPLDEVTGW